MAAEADAKTAVAAVTDTASAAEVTAAEEAVTALETALANAADLSADDTDVASARERLTTLKESLADAKAFRMREEQRTAITAAVTAVRTAVAAVTDTASAAEVTAAEEAVTALETALANAADLSADDTDVASARERLTTLTESLADAKASRMTAIKEMEAAEMALQEEQRTAITAAVTAVRTAVAAVTDTASAAEVTAAEEAVTALETALANAADLSADDTDVASARERLTTLTESLADAKASRMTAIKEMEAAEMALQEEQRTAITAAVTAVRTAVAAVTDTASDDEVTAAEEAVTALETALANAADLSADDTDVASARERLTTLTESLADAKASRMTAIEEMAAAEMARQEEQRTAITAAVTAAKTAVDALTSTSTNDEVTAADAAIAALETALRDGTALSEDDIDVDIALSDLAALKTSLGIVKASRTTAMEAAETAEQGRQRTAIMDAVTAVRTAVEAVTDTASDAEVTAAEEAVAALETALANAEGLSADDTDVASAQGRLTMLKESLDTAKDSRIEAQRTEIKTAVTAARTAVDAVTDDANDAVVKEAEDAVAALETAVENGTGLSEGDTDVASAQGTLTTLKGFLAIARTSRMTALQEREEAAEMAQRTAITAAVTAARTAVDAVTDTTEPEVVTAAEDAVAALETAIENGTDLAADDTEVVSAQGTLTMLTESLATAKASRMTAMEAQEMVNMAIETAKAAQATAQRRVDALDNYSTSVDQQAAEDALVALFEASEDDNLPEEDKEKYKTAYATLNQKKKDQAALMQRNDLITSKWISAIDRWDDSINDNTVNLNLAPFLDVRTPMPADVVDTEDYFSTKIRAFRLNSQGTSLGRAFNLNNEGASLGEGMEIEGPGEAWTARQFQAGPGQYLKIFTNRSSEPEAVDTGKTWVEFWDPLAIGSVNTQNNQVLLTEQQIKAYAEREGINVGDSYIKRTTNLELTSFFEDRAYNEVAVFGSDYNAVSNEPLQFGTRSATGLDQVEQDLIKIWNDPEVGVSIPRVTPRHSGLQNVDYEFIRGENYSETYKSKASKVHESDVVIRDSNNDVIELTMEPTVLGAQGGRLGGKNTIPEEFLGVPGQWTCGTRNTRGNSLSRCAVSVDEEGFIRVEYAPYSEYEEDRGRPHPNPGPDVDGYKTVVHPLDIIGEARIEFTAGVERKDIEGTVTTHRPDTSYTVMGYWIDEDGEIYGIDTFATAKYTPRTTEIRRLTGSATYSGDAVGVYVMNKGDETNMDLHDGEFKATVSLTADFGISESSNDHAFTVSGTIEDFESFTRAADDLSAWTLELNESSVNKSDGSFSGATTGEGNWQGQFYGTDNLDTAVTTDDLPLAAVGDFSGDFGNSNQVVGVFSAEKTEE